MEAVVAKSLLDAPEEAVQLLLDAEKRGDLRYICTKAISMMHSMPRSISNCSIIEAAHTRLSCHAANCLVHAFNGMHVSSWGSCMGM